MHSSIVENTSSVLLKSDNQLTKMNAIINKALQCNSSRTAETLRVAVLHIDDI